MKKHIYANVDLFLLYSIFFLLPTGYVYLIVFECLRKKG